MSIVLLMLLFRTAVDQSQEGAHILLCGLLDLGQSEVIANDLSRVGNTGCTGWGQVTHQVVVQVSLIGKGGMAQFTQQLNRLSKALLSIHKVVLHIEDLLELILILLLVLLIPRVELGKPHGWERLG